MSDLLLKFLLTVGVFAAGALTFYAYKYPKPYFRFYCVFVWMLAALTISLAIWDGSIERAYQVTIPQKGFLYSDVQLINTYVCSYKVSPYLYIFLKGLVMYMTLLITLPLWMAGLGKRQN